MRCAWPLVSKKDDASADAFSSSEMGVAGGTRRVRLGLYLLMKMTFLIHFLSCELIVVPV